MKKILLVLGVALLAAGCSSQSGTNTTGTSSYTAPTSDNSAPAPTTFPGGTTAAASDSSNASLNADLGNIDGQMSSLNSDSANVDSSVGQQQAPGAQ